MVVTVPATRAHAAQPGDAELIRLSAEFDPLHAALVAVKAEMVPIEAAFHATLEQHREANIGGSIPNDEFIRIMDSSGYAAMSESANAAYDRCDAVTTAIRAIPATTFVGLAVKVKAAAHDCGFLRRFNQPADDMDWDVQCFHGLLKEFERLAAVQS
jgi:hypothetical protein